MSDLKPLTKRQRALLEYIRTYVAENRFSPSMREMMTACEISSTSVVSYNLRLLEADGYLTRAHKTARTMTLTEMVS
jgi:repressor LexA